MVSLDPTFVLINPLDDTLEFEYLDYKDIKHWQSDDVIDIESARFSVSSERLRGCPILLRDRLVVSQTLFMLHEGSLSMPFHCVDCAEEWSLWFCHKQYEWGMTYHAHWYRQYVGSEREAWESLH